HRDRADSAPAVPRPGQIPVQRRRSRPGDALRDLRPARHRPRAGRAPPFRSLRRLPRGDDRRVRRAERPRLERRAAQVHGDPARAYQSWLRWLGGRSVVLAGAPPDYSARAEANLVGSGGSGLLPVFWSPHVTIFEVPDASPIVTGAGDATVMWMWPSRLVVSV